MDHLEEARRVIGIEIEALEGLRDRLGGELGEAVELIRKRLDTGGKIIVVGVGKSGSIGRKLAATLTSTGAPAISLNAQDALHGDLGVLARNDVGIALSYSGETEEILNLLPHLRRRGLPMIAITGVPGSTLGGHCEVILNARV